ncbi:sensor histidine kinase [Peterkaempfera sp. SMS 1(5)a]|uniref:sensor histidine kinase n=1 Tax=Peterkaempfera podocarpi TaxID=3232308 RepID=UPI00366B3DF3
MDREWMKRRWQAGTAGLLRATEPPPPLSRWAWTADAVLALLLAAGMLAAAGHGSGPMDVAPLPLPPAPAFPMPQAPPDPGAVPASQSAQVVLALLVGLPLAVRRRWPLAAYGTVLAAGLLFHRSPSSDAATVSSFIACVIAAYSAAMYSRYRNLAMAGAIAGALLIGIAHGSNVPGVRPGYVPLLMLIPIGLAANTMHSWKQRMRGLQEQQEAATRQAVDRERSRMARELHDVITHNVSVMTIQAGAARMMLEKSPEQAREALLAVEAGGRAAMAELRHTMGLLTMAADGSDPVDAMELAPQPGLGQLEALAGRVRKTGVPVELAVTGTPVPLPAGVDLAAYRVVQEALTNAVKHAAGARVRTPSRTRPAR